MIEDRPYQTACGVAIRDSWREGLRAPLVSIPTGGGKTVIFAKLPDEADVKARGRMLAIAHRFELIEQAANKIRLANPGLRVGVVMGDRDEVGADVVVGSVQTLRNPARLARLRNVGTVVVDEAHHATAPSYRTILTHYGVLPGAGRDAGRNAYAVGFTATPSRGDGAALGDIWDRVVFKRTIADMIRGEGRGGYLVVPRGITVDVEDLDLSKVGKSRGDYKADQLGEAMTDSLAPARIIEAWQEHANNKATILFAPTVAFAELMAEQFRREGVKAGVVHGMLPPDQRAAVLRAFEAGDITVLCNCMVLTEGTDLPIAEVAIIARPTCHHGLYVQMVGRVLRLYPGKTGALVLDVSGASKRHSLVAHEDLIGSPLRDLTAKLDGDEDTEDDQITLVDELATGSGALDVTYKDGRLVVEHVDLFHGSKSAWSTTYGGKWFLEVGDRDHARYLVLVPNWSGTAWHVIEVSKKPGGLTKRGVRGSCYIACDVPDIGYAMSLAEADITWREQSLASKQSGWRKKPVSQAQAVQLQRFGLVLPEGGRSNEASELIGRVYASDRLDRVS